MIQLDAFAEVSFALLVLRISVVAYADVMSIDGHIQSGLQLLIGSNQALEAQTLAISAVIVLTPVNIVHALHVLAETQIRLICALLLVSAFSVCSQLHVDNLGSVLPLGLRFLYHQL